MAGEKGANLEQIGRTEGRVATEQGKLPDRRFENQPEHLGEQAKEQATEGKAGTEQASGLTSSQDIGGGAANQARQQQIEQIMAEGLEDLYLSLEPAKQQEFKKEGERTARVVNQLLSEAKLKIAKIVKLITNWLSIIPGVNKYFLEQETKLKVDEILQLKKGGE